MWHKNRISVSCVSPLLPLIWKRATHLSHHSSIPDGRLRWGRGWEVGEGGVLLHLAEQISFWLHQLFVVKGSLDLNPKGLSHFHAKVTSFFMVPSIGETIIIAAISIASCFEVYTGYGCFCRSRC